MYEETNYQFFNSFPFMFEFYLNIFQFKHLFPFDSIILGIQMASKQLFSGLPLVWLDVVTKKELHIEFEYLQIPLLSVL